MQKLSYTTEQKRGSCCACLVSSVDSERLLGGGQDFCSYIYSPAFLSSCSARQTQSCIFRN